VLPVVHSVPYTAFQIGSFFLMMSHFQNVLPPQAEPGQGGSAARRSVKKGRFEIGCDGRQK
jgi:hypothetical protein